MKIPRHAMIIGKPVAAFVVALVLWAWSSGQGSAQPLPPPPRMLPPAGGPPRPVMGPIGGSEPARGISVQGGIGGPAGPPSGMSALPNRPSGVFVTGGYNTMGGAPVRPTGGPPPVTRPSTTTGPGYPRGPISGPARPGSTGPGLAGGRAPGVGGLSSLAKSGAIARSPSTFPLSPQSLVNQGNLVRQNFNRYDCFRGNWWNRHAGAWQAARWSAVASSTYWTPGWYYCYSYCGYSSQPYYYDYGSTVIYERDYVYVNGDAVATQEQYADEAMSIAETGKQAETTDDQEWLPLGVFAMIQGDQQTGNFLFQLAVNKSGVLRGNYYNALSDTTVPVVGSVDQTSQRAAWTLADRKEPVFEAGFANLTRSQTTMLVHFARDRTQQWTLVRIGPSAEPKSPGEG